jgi:hypothetical protein
MWITVSNIDPLTNQQILHDLTMEELTSIVGGYTRRRRNSRSTETPLPRNIYTQLQDWRTELNTMMDDLRKGFGT